MMLAFNQMCRGMGDQGFAIVPPSAREHRKYAEMMPPSAREHRKYAEMMLLPTGRRDLVARLDFLFLERWFETTIFKLKFCPK